MPDETQIESLGLAVGSTRVLEEVVMTFKHDRVMPWILPGIQPTRVTVRVPQLAVVGIRDDKVAFEHIWWDQASVLAQIGLLDDDGLPVLGEEEARKITALGDPGD